MWESQRTPTYKKSDETNQHQERMPAEMQKVINHTQNNFNIILYGEQLQNNHFNSAMFKVRTYPTTNDHNSLPQFANKTVHNTLKVNGLPT